MEDVMKDAEVPMVREKENDIAIWGSKMNKAGGLFPN